MINFEELATQTFFDIIDQAFFILAFLLVLYVNFYRPIWITKFRIILFYSIFFAVSFVTQYYAQ